MDLRRLTVVAVALGAGFAACVPGFASRRDVLGTGGGGGATIGTCADGLRNGDETGLDCGGKTCPACPLGQGCATVADCAGAGGVDAGATPLVQCLEGACVPPVRGSWQMMSTGPPARRDASMTYDPFNQQTVLVAGTDNDTSMLLDDTWTWDGMMWLPRSPLPVGTGGRHGALFVDEPLSARALAFGGCGLLLSKAMAKSDLFEWDGQVWTQLYLGLVPPSRCYMASAYDLARKRLVLFGGEDVVPTFFGDVWEWDGSAWKTPSAATPPPSARSRAGAVYDTARSVTVVFGGFRHDTADTRFDETWTWDGAAWKLRTPAVRPTPRNDLAMAYDARRRRAVLFGGQDAATPSGLQDTWEWDGARWTEVPLPPAISPPPRSGHSMAFDAVRGRVVMFGGGADPATWEYVASANACASGASCDDTFSCVDGLCCEQPSCGVCQGCNVLGSAGRCSPLPAGAKDPRCATSCDGAGACK